MEATITDNAAAAKRLIDTGLGMRWMRATGRSKAARLAERQRLEALSREFLDKARGLGYRPCAGWLGCHTIVLLSEASKRGFCPACEAVAQGITAETGAEVRGGTNP